jgi:3-hydroxypropanoate dehydrogenase
MSGFANAAVDKEFFPGGSVRSNFLCALGHGDAARLPPASPRPQFDDLAEIL